MAKDCHWIYLLLVYSDIRSFWPTSRVAQLHWLNNQVVHLHISIADGTNLENQQDLTKSRYFFRQTAPSQMVINETPRKRLRIPPTLGNMVKRETTMISSPPQPPWWRKDTRALPFPLRCTCNQNKFLLVEKLALAHLELAIRAKIACFDLNDVGNAPPRKLYSR